MKTSELITLLSTNIEPVTRHRFKTIIGSAIGASAALAVALMMLFFGVRTHPDSMHAWIIFAVKFIFTVGVTVLASVYLFRVARPGGERKTPLGLIAIPFGGIALLAAGSLALTSTTRWHASLLGQHWWECSLAIPVFAIVPFAIVIWALRRTAPTDLTRAGAFAGLIAGAVSALGYTFHCVDDTLPFIALWYGGTIAVCTAVGAYLGPRLLRW